MFSTTNISEPEQIHQGMCLANLHRAHVAESDWPHSRPQGLLSGRKRGPAGPGPWEGSEAQPIILGPRKASNIALCHM